MNSILLADDDSALRSALALMLEKKLNLQHLTEATNMEELLVRVKADHPTLILLDWELPGVLRAYGLPQWRNPDGKLGPDRYIEAQVWAAVPLPAEAGLPSGQPFA